MPDSEIDFSDIPPLIEKFWKNAIRNPWYRPRKQQVTVRVDADVLAWLRNQGKGYQSRLNALLRSAMLEQLSGKKEERLMGLRRLFRKEKQEHRVLREAVQRAGQLVPEYHRPTPECPHPERWSMYDSMTAEVEVLEFLRTLVTTIKPNLVVETGAFMGVSTPWIAAALRLNGSGRIISCECDATVFAAARQKIDASDYRDLIDLRQESSLEMKVDGTIDLFFSDSDMPVREQEVRRFLPHISPFGIILMHDASSHMKQVREAALMLEREGLISVVLLPTPRGLVVAQKREGRK